MIITLRSYKKAQGFKKDYVRHNGQFLKFGKLTGTHKWLSVDLQEGDTLDARGSAYNTGVTRWTAHKTQSWCKFSLINGEIVALDYDGNKTDFPHWAQA